MCIRDRFYVSDKNKTDLPYLDEQNSSDSWFKLRREEMLSHSRIVEQADCLQDKYGFQNFKLKGGVFSGEYEMETVRALKYQFPDARINIDPNGAWELEEAIRLCRPMQDILTYIEAVSYTHLDVYKRQGLGSLGLTGASASAGGKHYTSQGET